MFEINLVPDVKAEMIRAQKKRNVVFFASAVVSAIAAGLVLLLLSVKLGQDIKINNQNSKLELMSDTIEKYDGLEELLTVQKQLSDINTITDNKKAVSRVFAILDTLVKMGNGDTVDISALDIDFSDSEDVQLVFDGQANAGPDTDGIDYRVLESFTKSIGLMKYDYGRYVDKNGSEIPTICIFETDENGIPYSKSNGSIYALWAKGVDGCDPSRQYSSSSLSDDGEEELIGNTVDAAQLQAVDTSNGADGTTLVEIYRTPQYKEWYNKGYMNENGEISNVEHFASECITYSLNSSDTFVTENSCEMSPDGIEIVSSTNGKETSGDLVLMFSAVLHMNPAVFSFRNKHMITISPDGRQNVTDSFVQVGEMFTERAKALGTE